MQILKNYDLKNLNTFGVPAFARLFVEIENEAELQKLFDTREFKENKKIFLGGGSNVLFTKDFDGMVVLNKLKGIEILNEDSDSVTIHSMSGVVWHNLVIFAVERGYWGIENLAFIPGTVGAAPMQNIGAYGAELKNVLENVEAYEIESGKKKIFTKEECEFGYRDSIFKNKLKEKYFILAITLKLSKIEQKNISYKILAEHLEKNKVEVKGSKDISMAVTSIRKNRLPDPNVIGNAGSFFKNVFLSKEKDKERIQKLLADFPTMPYFDEGEMIKIPSAWLIEECRWKGKRAGNAGVHEHHALVLVNHGGATGDEMKSLAEQIITSVFDKFGLLLEPEVNLI